MGQPRPEEDDMEPEGVVACALQRREWMIIYRALIYSLGPVASKYGLYGEVDVQRATRSLVTAMKADPELGRVLEEHIGQELERERRRKERRDDHA